MNAFDLARQFECSIAAMTKEREELLEEIAHLKAVCDDELERRCKAESERKELREERDSLSEELYSLATQHRCGCGHPHCNRCADYLSAMEVLGYKEAKP